MNWGYVWLAGYGVGCIVIFILVLWGEVVLLHWVENGGLDQLDKKIHWQRTRREELMRDLKE
jgi:hypothetical protein